MNSDGAVDSQDTAAFVTAAVPQRLVQGLPIGAYVRNRLADRALGQHGLYLRSGAKSIAFLRCAPPPVERCRRESFLLVKRSDCQVALFPPLDRPAPEPLLRRIRCLTESRHRSSLSSVYIPSQTTTSSPLTAASMPAWNVVWSPLPSWQTVIVAAWVDVARMTRTNRAKRGGVLIAFLPIDMPLRPSNIIPKTRLGLNGGGSWVDRDGFQCDCDIGYSPH